MKTTNVLFIHPRKGLYRITKCSDCGHVFGCDHCDANLVTYRSSPSQLSMLCHQCQTHYNYPNQCPKCHARNIGSMVGGADELSEQLIKIFDQEPIRYDVSTTKKARVSDVSHPTTNKSNMQIGITTRVYDPLIPYQDYANIVFIHAENLFASPDYQALEESMRQIAQLFNELAPKTSVFFDSKLTQQPLLAQLATAHNLALENTSITDNKDDTNEISTHWYEQFLKEEGASRKQFEFPPFHNIVLLTSQNKNKKLSHDIIDGVYAELQKITETLPELSVSSPYEARFLKRKGMYSYHTLIRYPRKYKYFVPLRKAINEINERFQVQVRLNPRHLF